MDGGSVGLLGGRTRVGNRIRGRRMGIPKKVAFVFAQVLFRKQALELVVPLQSEDVGGFGLERN